MIAVSFAPFPFTWIVLREFFWGMLLLHKSRNSAACRLVLAKQRLDRQPWKALTTYTHQYDEPVSLLAERLTVGGFCVGMCAE